MYTGGSGRETLSVGDTDWMMRGRGITTTCRQWGAGQKEATGRNGGTRKQLGGMVENRLTPSKGYGKCNSFSFTLKVQPMRRETAPSADCLRHPHTPESPSEHVDQDEACTDGHTQPEKPSQ